MFSISKTPPAERLHNSSRPSHNELMENRVKQSVCEWCFTGDFIPNPLSFEELCRSARNLGIKSVELADVQMWPTLKKYDLVCALANSHGFEAGLNDSSNHGMCMTAVSKAIDACAEYGFPAVITFSGFRNGIKEDEGLDATVEALKQLAVKAEYKKVTICLEVLNTRVTREMQGHPGYMCDTVEWAVEACRRVSSDRVKILFDVYHVQIMQGDIITRIEAYKDFIGHYHVAGVPGRNEINDSQEINYPAVIRAISSTGYDGYIGHEFIPTGDPVQSLKEAYAICSG